jgi:hypothetical protein
MVAGTEYYVALYLESNFTLTGAQFLVGGTAGTDKWIAALYNNSGILVANSTTGGQTVASLPNTMVSFPFTTTYAAPGPGYYYLAVQSNGTTAKVQTYTTPGAIFRANSVTGTFGSLPSLTATTGYANNVGPVSCVY